MCTSYRAHLQLYSNNIKDLEISCTCQIRYVAVKVAVWLGDDDMDEGLVFFSELAGGWDDTQDLQSTMTLCQHSVDKTILVSQTCLELKISTPLSNCDTSLAMFVLRI